MSLDAFLFHPDMAKLRAKLQQQPSTQTDPSIPNPNTESTEESQRNAFFDNLPKFQTFPAKIEPSNKLAPQKEVKPKKKRKPAKKAEKGIKFYEANEANQKPVFRYVYHSKIGRKRRNKAAASRDNRGNTRENNKAE